MECPNVRHKPVTTVVYCSTDVLLWMRKRITASSETVADCRSITLTVRLQEASVGYTIPRKWLGGVCDINVSVVGRNLWMIYCRAPFDPEAVANTGNYYQGIDNFMLPSTRNIGVNVKINF